MPNDDWIDDLLKFNFGSSGKEDLRGDEPQSLPSDEASADSANKLKGSAAVQRILAADGSSTQVLERIGDYKLVREVGRGAMGIVFEAEQTALNRKVALKLLPARFAGMKQSIQRFKREAHAAGRLHHTNIVPIYDLGEVDGHWFYTMELVRGRSLDAVVDELKLLGSDSARIDVLGGSESSGSSSAGPAAGGRESKASADAHYRRIAEMFAGVADALHAAAEESVIHRDIKPSNLLLGDDGVLKIVDFGLARFDDAPSMTVSGQLVGTPAYMSPEQAMARRARLDHRTDIYSLGATIYEILTLQQPFVGDSIQDICSQIISKDPTEPHRKDPRVPLDLSVIVMKAMEKDPDRRYQTALEFARDLRRFAEGDAILARQVGPLGKAWRKIRRHKIRTALVGTILVLSVVGAWLFAERKQAEARRVSFEYERLLRTGEDVVAFLGRDAEHGELHGDAVASPESADYFSQAIALLPDRPEAWWLRSLSQNRLLEQRLADLDEALARGLSKGSYRRLRAYLFVRWRKQAAVERESEWALAHAITSAVDAYAEARVLEAKGRPLPSVLAQLGDAIQKARTGSFVHYLALNRRAKVMLKQGDYTSALEDLSVVRQLAGDTLPILIRTAHAWQGLGQAEKAEALMVRALDSARRDSAFWLAWDTCRRLGVSVWRQRVLVSWLDQRPIDLHAITAAAFLPRSRIDALRLLDAHWDALMRGGSSVRHKALEAKGRLLGATGSLADGLAAIESALRDKPTCAACRCIRNGWLCDLGKLDEAVAGSEELVADAPTYWQAWGILAMAQARLGSSGPAKEAAREALRLAPLEADSHVGMGTVYLLVGDASGAERAWRQALEIDANNAEAHYLLGGLLLGSTAGAGSAMSHLQRSIELDGRNLRNRLALARALRASDRWPDVLTTLEAATELPEARRSIEVWYELVKVQLRLGPREQVEVKWRARIDDEPEDTSAWKGWYSFCSQTARYRDMLAACRKLAELDPGNNAWALREAVILVSNLDRPAEGLPILNRLLEQGYTRPQSLDLKARALDKLDMREELAEVRRQLTKTRATGRAWAKYAQSLFGVGRVRSALEAIATAETKTDQRGYVRAVKCFILTASGDYAAAFRVCQAESKGARRRSGWWTYYEARCLRALQRDAESQSLTEAYLAQPAGEEPSEGMAYHHAVLGHGEVVEEMLAALGVPEDTAELVNRACMYALLDDTERAVEWFGKAIEGGYHLYSTRAVDHDLHSLRGIPEFERLLVQATRPAPEGESHSPR